MSSFMQLREESTLAMVEALMEGDLDFMDDDDNQANEAQANERVTSKSHGAELVDKAPKTNKARGKPKSSKPRAKPRANPAKQVAKKGLGVSKKGGISKRK